MTVIYKASRLNSILVNIIFLKALLVGCSPASPLPSEIVQGSPKEDVIALCGEPDRAREFILPEVPFFGSQESLINLVPSGTVIEEWVYEIGEEELYIWFTGDIEDARENWPVLDLAKYPKGAVY